MAIDKTELLAALMELLGGDNKASIDGLLHEPVESRLSTTLFIGPKDYGAYLYTLNKEGKTPMQEPLYDADRNPINVIRGKYVGAYTHKKPTGNYNKDGEKSRLIFTIESSTGLYSLSASIGTVACESLIHMLNLGLSEKVDDLRLEFRRGTEKPETVFISIEVNGQEVNIWAKGGYRYKSEEDQLRCLAVLGIKERELKANN